MSPYARTGPVASLGEKSQSARSFPPRRRLRCRRVGVPAIVVFPIVLRSEFCCCLTERSSCRQTSVVSLCRRTFVVSLCRRTSVVCRRTSNISSNAVRRSSRPTRRRSPPRRRNRNLPGRVFNCPCRGRCRGVLAFVVPPNVPHSSERLLFHRTVLVAEHSS